MSRPPHFTTLNIPHHTEFKLVTAAHNSSRVRGLTHSFYKYPARFSPVFVRAAIEAFTQPGDLVLDNHVGGGTTLVEALALGRNAIGVDISTLATFVSGVKTTVLEDDELRQLSDWADRVASFVHIHKPTTQLVSYAALGYYRHLNSRERWRLRKGIEQSLASAVSLGSERLERFARCVVLRTAQWALDGRKNLPRVGEFRRKLAENAIEMIEGARAFVSEVKSHPSAPVVRVINRSSTGLEADESIRGAQAPKLVVTSPPYPGVHVLYHRWQVDGRKEAPLPFMIANKLDGAGSSHYTMGDRKSRELNRYFDSVEKTMSSVASLADQNTIVIQMLAFSEPHWQLPRYLEAMENAGLVEIFLPTLHDHGDGRLWRSVPSRRWYSEQRGETPSAREVVLIHRKRTIAANPDLMIMPPSEVFSAKLDTSER